MPADLTRFHLAQEQGGTYAAALAELRSGHKRTHWMWFVFPQVAGLGRSPTAQLYAISGLEEARDYLADPVLGSRLVDCAQALTALPGSDPVAVLGGIDAQKLCSSMTLFALAADQNKQVEQDDQDEQAEQAEQVEQDEQRATFRAVLDQYFGGADDPETLRRIRQ